jgi:hypothetical protein
VPSTQTSNGLDVGLPRQVFLRVMWSVATAATPERAAKASGTAGEMWSTTHDGSTCLPRPYDRARDIAVHLLQAGHTATLQPNQETANAALAGLAAFRQTEEAVRGPHQWPRGHPDQPQSESDATTADTEADTDHPHDR